MHKIIIQFNNGESKYEYESDIVPNVGDKILLLDHKHQLVVEQRTFAINKISTGKCSLMNIYVYCNSI